MVSILAFDSSTMKQLLSGQDPKYFSEEFPIFYRNKVLNSDDDEEYNNAIDVAFAHN